MRNPTCYLRFDAEGQTIVSTLCPGCAAEIVIHPQPLDKGTPVPWYEIRCEVCGRTAKELGFGSHEGG